MWYSFQWKWPPPPPRGQSALFLTRMREKKFSGSKCKIYPALWWGTPPPDPPPARLRRSLAILVEIIWIFDTPPKNKGPWRVYNTQLTFSPSRLKQDAMASLNNSPSRLNPIKPKGGGGHIVPPTIKCSPLLTVLVRFPPNLVTFPRILLQIILIS